MFTQLLASRPVRRHSAGGATASVTFHGLLVGTAVFVSLGNHQPKFERPVAQSVIYVPPATPIPPAPRLPSAVPRVLVRPTVPLPGISFPIDAAPALSDIGLIGLKPPTDFMRSPGFSAGGVPGSGKPDPTPGATYLAEQVEVQVTIADGSPMPKYPNLLRSTGMDGTARIRFVVDTLGRAELATAVDVDASHPVFAFAIRSTLPRMRFTPALVGGRPVRQLVELPVIFRVGR